VDKHSDRHEFPKATLEGFRFHALYNPSVPRTSPHLHHRIGHAKPSDQTQVITNLVEDFASMRRTLLLLAKATISILLLYFSLRWVNVGTLADRLSRFQPAG
jgi:hypothetical protein